MRYLCSVLIMLAQAGGRTTAPEGQEPIVGQTGPALAVARLEIELRLRDAKVAEAIEWLSLEKALLEQVRREMRAFPSPRRLQTHEQYVAEVEATVVYRKASRDAVAGALDQAKRRVAGGSPEEDVDQARARLDIEVRVARARLAAHEAQIASSEALVESERASLDNLIASAAAGIVPPVAVRQAQFRLGHAEMSLARSKARRDLAYLDLNQVELSRADLERPGRSPSSAPLTVAELARRVIELESEVRRLEDESEFLTRRVQRLIEKDQTFVRPGSQ